MLIAQISDTHYLTDGTTLANQFNTAAAFTQLIKAIAQQPMQPDLILFSGDVGERATPEEYRTVGNALRALGIPVRIVPGNHDAREVMQAELPDMTGIESNHLCLFDDGFDIAIIGLDTSKEGQPSGHLCPERLDWLEHKLARVKDRPVVIFMHHPPITTGLDAMDRMGLVEGKDQLSELVRQHGKVEAILCGHMHRSIFGRFAGVPVQVAPSASHQIAFDLREKEPYRFSHEPAQYLMHLWSERDGLISHTVSVNTNYHPL